MSNREQGNALHFTTSLVALQANSQADVQCVQLTLYIQLKCFGVQLATRSPRGAATQQHSYTIPTKIHMQPLEQEVAHQALHKTARLQATGPDVLNFCFFVRAQRMSEQVLSCQRERKLQRQRVVLRLSCFY